MVLRHSRVFRRDLPFEYVAITKTETKVSFIIFEPRVYGA
jgi:hypothetical protein